jgi:hypothetical protein
VGAVAAFGLACTTHMAVFMSGFPDGMLVALTAIVFAVAVARVGVPWYFGTHLGLDNGVCG